jgi:hypothetical protein
MTFDELLAELEGKKLTPAVAHRKAEILMRAALADGQAGAAMKALEIQARLEGLLVDKLQSSVNISIKMTPDRRRQRILELSKKGGYLRADGWAD